MNPLFVLVTGVAISMLVIPLAWRLAPYMGMIDEPDERKAHAKPIPRIGGWGIVFGTLIPIVLFVPLDPLIQSYVFGGLVLFVTGAWDDATEIGHYAKFGGQLLAVGIVVFYGDLWIALPPYVGFEEVSPLFGKPFTFFAIVGVINAINHSDGLDGLAGGESLLSLIVIAFLAHIVDDGILAVVIACATMGGVLGFLRYNTHPAQVFMGDTGSQFLGFTLGFLTVYLTQVCHVALSSALPLLLIGLPIVDILAVLFLRIRGKMNWFLATRNHVHHRLLDRGFNHYESVIVIYSVQALLVISALFMRYENDWWVTAWYLFVCGSVFVSLTVSERKGWYAHRRGDERAVSQAITYLKARGIVTVVPGRLVLLLVPSFVGSAALLAETVPRDFGIMSGVLFVLLLFEMIFGKRGDTIAVRAAIAGAAIFTVYLTADFVSDVIADIELARTIYFVVLAVAIGLSVRFSKKLRFRTTPTDYLVVFGLITVAAFTNETFDARAARLLVIEAVILMYGCEILIGRQGGRWSVLNTVTLFALGVLAARGLLLPV